MENNGKGLFYGVIGVATLIVAIIGATFAYFTATANDTTNVTGTTATEVDMQLVVSELTATTNKLIPLNLMADTDPYATLGANGQFANAVGGACVDANGNEVCDVYKIVVTNRSNAQVQVRGTLALTSSAANLKWKLINVTNEATNTFAASEVGYATVVAAAATNPTVGDLTVDGNADLTDITTDKTAANHILQGTSGTNSRTYYVMVWLEETGAPQEDDDANKGYTGVVTFNGVDLSGNRVGQLTATFSGE